MRAVRLVIAGWCGGMAWRAPSRGLMGRALAVAVVMGAWEAAARAQGDEKHSVHAGASSGERNGELNGAERDAVGASAPREEVRAFRGTAGSIEVEHAGGAIRARAVEPNAPVLVRVRPAARPGAFTIEYLGLRTGVYDLSLLVERVDGRAAALGPIPVRFESRLPADAGTDVYGMGAPELDLRVWYREGLTALAAVWALAPVVVLVRRRLNRRVAEVPAPPAPEPTATERLRAIVAEAGQRELSVEERARMELLLLRAMREAAGNGAGRVEGTPGGAREIAAALAALRRGEATGAIVRAVEAWMHAERGGARDHAVAAAAGVAGASAAGPGGGA